LFRARRIAEPIQILDHVRPIIDNLTRDKETNRIRDLQPEDIGRSIYDELIGPATGGPESSAIVWWLSSKERAPRFLYYSETDALEDQILFPDELAELQSEAGKPDTEVAKRKKVMAPMAENQTKNRLWMEKGPEFLRFVNDLSTDEEISDTENEIMNSVLKERPQKKSETKPMDRRRRTGPKARLANIPEATRLEGVIEDVDDSEEEADSFDDEDLFDAEIPDHFWRTKVCQKFIREIHRYRAPGGNFEDYTYDTQQRYWTELRKLDGVELIIEEWIDASYDQEAQEMHETWIEYMERERSPVFKEMFHDAAALLEPGVSPKYEEANCLLRLVRHSQMKEIRSFKLIAELLKWLDINPSDNSRAVKDMIDAFCLMCPSFALRDTVLAAIKLDTTDGKLYTKSQLRHAKVRASNYPLERTYGSEETRPPNFFPDIDKPSDLHQLPIEWDMITRPVIAKLFKAYVIEPAYREPNFDAKVSGMALVCKEPHLGSKDMYIMYSDRIFLRSDFKVSGYPDLRSCAINFAASHPRARFSVLRVWSCAYFWPLMVGPDSRQVTSFLDCRGRTWDFKMLPKDVIGSDNSMHSILKLRHLERFKNQLQLGTKVILRRDIVLVMGEDESECEKLSVGVAFAVQTRPWIRELDMWKSFINVDAKFILQDLDPRWLD
jgi:hypothetical protein